METNVLDLADKKKEDERWRETTSFIIISVTLYGNDLLVHVHPAL